MGPTLLLGLDGVTVTRVVAAGDGEQGGPVAHLATADEWARCCPERGPLTEQVPRIPRDPGWPGDYAGPPMPPWEMPAER